MTKPPSTDPFSMWRDIVSQWEKSTNELGNKAMGSEEFSSSMNKAASLSLALQQMTGEAMARYQTAANLPTRADIVSIGERLRAIEETLGRVAAAVDRLAAADSVAAAAPVRPRRTRRPPGEADALEAPSSADKRSDG
jgi:hypothetical protein